jgi:hypothetical protein
VSIPAAREVEYTDDGCSVYQCLSCYNTWEGRTSILTSECINPEESDPINYKFKTLYHWKFCPYCGIEWTVFPPDNSEEDLEHRIEKHLRSQGLPSYHTPKPKYTKTEFIVLEAAVRKGPEDEEWSKPQWKKCWAAIYETDSAASVHKAVKYRRAVEQERIEEYRAEDPEWESWSQFKTIYEPAIIIGEREADRYNMFRPSKWAKLMSGEIISI